MNIGYFYWNDFYWNFIVINFNTHTEGVIYTYYAIADGPDAFKLLYPLMSVNTYKLFFIAFSQKSDNNFSFIYICKYRRKNKRFALLTLVRYFFLIFFLVFMPIRKACYPKREHFKIYLFFINNQLVF